MQLQGCWRRVLGCGLMAAALTTSSGCLSFLHPVEPQAIPWADACRQLPRSCHRHVYVFMVHGLDPFDYANFSGVRDYLHTLGFNQTYYGQLYHTGHFNREIHRIHREDPEAKFVLIGFSLGANMVRDLAHDAKREDIRIDLLVYLGGNTLENIPEDCPDNAGHIVNILASGCVWNGAWLDGAENIHEDDVFHFGSPTHLRTLEVLTREITCVAASVPAIEQLDSLPDPTSDDEPTPRPVSRDSSTAHDEWDFLKPVSRLRVAGEQNLD